MMSTQIHAIQILTTVCELTTPNTLGKRHNSVPQGVVVHVPSIDTRLVCIS